jgi:hypothetical protein
MQPYRLAKAEKSYYPRIAGRANIKVKPSEILTYAKRQGTVFKIFH